MAHRILKPLNFRAWIEEHRHLLKPPVGNAVVYEETDDFIVMVVGGPNARKDFHYNEGEEFFYQLEGDMVLKIHDGEKIVDIAIAEGEIFLLPARIPHSPQRKAHTVGLVMERKRAQEEHDGFLWFCEHCGAKLYEEYHHISDIVKQLPPIFERFYGNPDHCTCKRCGAVMQRPQKP
ncbi:MAG: 3-hydroxyanthranilate 3,4-dioxygenase [Bacteroidota bacterium]|nr:3-hydroxyanthranilate 3,4-dioxygenase [Candidatus Kapabacteria bacterium]MDW8220201.1 3-hydroxyanthranilate 3,4-dioxygenase [Bacteroidota bacterium]